MERKRSHNDLHFQHQPLGCNHGRRYRRARHNQRDGLDSGSRRCLLEPNAIVAGSAAFTLTVTGTNFGFSTVLWNGSPRGTTSVSNTALQAAITAADIATVGTAMVTVTTPAPGGGTSNALTFTITPPPPAISLLTPSSAIQGGGTFTLAVTGANFVPSSTVTWNGSSRPTTFVASTNLTANITAADIANIGISKVTVVNPAANGDPSPFSYLHPQKTADGLPGLRGRSDF